VLSLLTRDFMYRDGGVAAARADNKARPPSLPRARPSRSLAPRRVACWRGLFVLRDP